MRMEHLQYLIEIGRRRSISAAAQELYLGQTTLSTIVKSAEEELGFPIFYRTHNGVKPTAEGEAALCLIGDINACYEKILRLNTGFNAIAPIPLILSPTVNAILPLPLNRMFLERAPSGNLEFRMVTGSEVGGLIIKNAGNIGVVHFGKSGLESYCAIASRYQIQVKVLRQDRLCLLVRRDHPLAKRERVAARDIYDCHFAILPHFEASGNSRTNIRSFGAGNRYTTLPNVTLIQEAVCSQSMVAILSSWACTNSENFANLRTVQLEGIDEDGELFLCLIHRDESHLHHREKVLLQCIREYFQAVDAKAGLYAPEKD